MYFCLSVCLYVCLCVCLCVCLSVCLSLCLSVSVCLSVCLSFCLSVYVKGKVKFSHTQCRALGPGLIPVYRQSAHRWLFQVTTGGRLSLLSTRPAVSSLSQLKNVTVLWPVPNYVVWSQIHVVVNNLPKIARQHCPRWESNPLPNDHKSKLLTHGTITSVDAYAFHYTVV